MFRRTTLLSIGAALAAICAVLATTPSAHADLVAYWAFDESSGTTAPETSGSTGGPYTGTVYNGTSPGATWTTGQLDNALVLDGNDYVQTSDTAGLNTTFVSVSAWVYPTATNTYTQIICKDDGYGNGSWGLQGPRSQHAGSPFRFYVKLPAYTHVEFPSPPLNQWYHLVGTFDGTNVRLYVNGEDALVASASGSMSSSTTPITIGKEGNLYDSTGFRGTIDEPAVWDVGLTDGKAKSLYSLATTHPVHYGADQAQRVFDVYDAGSGATRVIDLVTWSYASGLSTPLGVVTQVPSGFSLKLAGDGTGLTGSVLPMFAIDVTQNPNLVAYWRLGEAAGATTAVEVKGTNGHANDGAYRVSPSGTSPWPSGHGQLGAIVSDPDTAVHFDGSSTYIDCGNDSSIRGSGWDGITLAAWVKPEAASLTGSHAVITKWDGYTANQDDYGLYLADGKPLVALSDAAHEFGLTANATLAADQWYFIAATWDNATDQYNLYINGVLDNSATDAGVTGLNGSSTRPLVIGAQSNGGSGFYRFFGGMIDEPAIFNTALSGEQIAALYDYRGIPEPSSLALLALGLVGLLGCGRRLGRGPCAGLPWRAP